VYCIPTDETTFLKFKPVSLAKYNYILINNKQTIKLDPYETGGRLLLTANFKVT